VEDGIGHRLVMECCLRWYTFFDSGMRLCDGGDDLSGGGCDVCRRPTWAVSLVGCGPTCRRQPLWQRVLGRAVEGTTASVAVCRGAGRGGRWW
jgi:hypothetical protein